MVMELSPVNVLWDSPAAYSIYILVGIESSTCHVTGFLNTAYSNQILQAIEPPTGEVLRASLSAIITYILLGIETSTFIVISFLYWASTTQVLVVMELSIVDILSDSSAAYTT